VTERERERTERERESEEIGALSNSMAIGFHALLDNTEISLF
jgi:hypothetical protein